MNIDLTGQRFGRRVVVSMAGKTKQNTILWECRCDCGAISQVTTGSLRAGRSMSCGCLKNDVTSARMIIHGKHNSAEWTAWSNMRQRCQNPKNPAFKNYGARGVAVCERWNLFENFLEDMGPRPPGMIIERQNNNGNYEPSNCIWTTQLEQTHNQRSNHQITHRGETRCLSEWARVLGKKYERVRGRLRLGWSFERAIS